MVTLEDGGSARTIDVTEQNVPQLNRVSDNVHIDPRVFGWACDLQRRIWVHLYFFRNNLGMVHKTLQSFHAIYNNIP